MKIIHKDILKLSIIFILWIIFYLNTHGTIKEAIKYFPMHLIITLGFYGIITISYNIIIIKDCKNDYKELLNEIKEAEDYYKSNNIKYN